MRFGTVRSPVLGSLTPGAEKPETRASSIVLLERAADTWPNVVVGRVPLIRSVVSNGCASVGRCGVTQRSLCRLLIHFTRGEICHVTLANPLSYSSRRGNRRSVPGW